VTTMYVCDRCRKAARGRSTTPLRKALSVWMFFPYQVTNEGVCTECGYGADYGDVAPLLDPGRACPTCGAVVPLQCPTCRGPLTEREVNP